MRIAIYPNVTKSGAGEILERVIKFANQYNIELLLPPKEGKFFYHEELINQNIEKEYIDMAISIGGDGTLLGLCRRLAKNGIPVCGINIGHLGFLADIEPGEIEAKLTKIINNHRANETRMWAYWCQYNSFYFRIYNWPTSR